MRLYVDPWDPTYAASVDAGDGGPAGQSSAQTDLAVEREVRDWRPVRPARDIGPPDVVLMVDGVRRNDARLWTEEPDGSTYPGLAASYAAGVVRCDLRRGTAELVGTRIGRGLFTASPSVSDLTAGQVRYAAYRVERGEPNDLQQAVQGPLTALEVGVSHDVRAGAAGGRAGAGVASRGTGNDPTVADRSGAADGADAADGNGAGADLLVVDGPLRDRRHLSRTIGYIKTHRKHYLPPELTAVVTRLAPGERSPVFLLGTNWHRHTWYLRLPTGTDGGRGAPWSGIVRVECPAELETAAVVELADLSAVTLPRFASTPYKDPRAPQNLIPIAGLERRLRALLGDPRLLHRALTMAARTAPAG